MINNYIKEACYYNYFVFSLFHFYTTRASPTFGYKLSNVFKKCVSYISSQIYNTSMQYQYYKTINTNDAKLCGFRI